MKHLLPTDKIYKGKTYLFITRSFIRPAEVLGISTRVEEEESITEYELRLFSLCGRHIVNFSRLEYKYFYGIEWGLRYVV